MTATAIRPLESDWWVPTPNARACLGMIGFSQYCVDTHGNVYNIKTQQQLKPFIDRRGYPNFTLWGDNGQRQTLRGHRLVAMAFVPVPKSLMPKDGSYDDLQVNHIDMCPSNNYYRNLEWCLNEENTIASFLGKEKHKTLPTPVVLFICKMISLGFRNKPIARVTGIGEFIIQNIRHGKSYVEISSAFTFPVDRNSFKCLSEQEHRDQEDQIRKYLLEDLGINSDHSEDRTISSPAVVEETISDLVPAATDVAASS